MQLSAERKEKIAAIVLLTGHMGAGKSTLSEKLKDRYDDVYGTDVGYVDKSTGKYVILKGEEKRRAISSRVKEILDKEKKGRNVLVEGYPPNFTDEYSSLVPHAKKVLYLHNSPAKEYSSVGKRSFQRGSSLLDDLKYARGIRAESERSLASIRRAVGEKRVETIKRDYADRGNLR